MTKNDSWMNNLNTTVMLIMFLFVNTCSLKKRVKTIGFIYIESVYYLYVHLCWGDTLYRILILVRRDKLDVGFGIYLFAISSVCKIYSTIIIPIKMKICNNLRKDDLLIIIVILILWCIRLLSSDDAENLLVYGTQYFEHSIDSNCRGRCSQIQWLQVLIWTLFWSFFYLRQIFQMFFS